MREHILLSLLVYEYNTLVSHCTMYYQKRSATYEMQKCAMRIQLRLGMSPKCPSRGEGREDI